MLNTRLKNILVGLVVIGLVLLAVLAPQYLPKFTKLHNVFDSPINMGLVVVLVVLITIMDVKIGIAFAFMVLMFAVYLMDAKNTQKIENFFADLIQSTPSGMVVKTGQSSILGQQEFAMPRIASIQLDPISEPTTTKGITPTMTSNKEPFESVTTISSSIQQSEAVIADNHQPNKTNDTNKIDSPTDTATNQQSEMNNQPIADHVQKILAAGANQKAPACATPQQYDFLTQQVPGDWRINGFDVAGCRYDLASRPQNLTVYGPPLSWCGTYDQQQTAKCGTVFYPLHG